MSAGAVVITGAAQGIGEAVARRFARTGVPLVLLDIDGSRVADVADRIIADGGDAIALRTDVTVGAQVDAAIAEVLDRHRSIDVVVNNAGRNTYLDAVSATESEWDDAFAVDLKAAWLVSRATLPAMIRQASGSIVNISSIHGRQTVAGTFPYAAAKSGIEGLTRSLAVDYARHGIRVNAVAPGWTHTRLVDEWVQREGSVDALERVRRAHPLGFIAEPDDVAAAVEFLAGPGARAITGIVLPVDAGLSISFRVD